MFFLAPDFIQKILRERGIHMCAERDRDRATEIEQGGEERGSEKKSIQGCAVGLT